MLAKLGQTKELWLSIPQFYGNARINKEEADAEMRTWKKMT